MNNIVLGIDLGGTYLKIGLVQNGIIVKQTSKSVDKNATEEETIFSLYIPTEKLKSLKIMSAEKNISLKELINSAIDEKYFK